MDFSGQLCGALDLCGCTGEDFLLLRRCFGKINVGVSAILLCVIQGGF
jgi:hypothetical protein